MKNIRKIIEEKFGSIAEYIYHNKIKVLVAMLVLIAGAVSQMPKVKVDVSNESYFNQKDKTLVDYRKFRDQFGRDELIIVAIESENIFTLDFLKKLKALHEEIVDNVPYIHDITSLVSARNVRGDESKLIVEDFLDNFPQTEEEVQILKKRAHDNEIYRNTILSENGKFTAILIETNNYFTPKTGTDAFAGFDDTTDTSVVDGDTTEVAQAPEEKKIYFTDEENSETVNAVIKIVEKYNSKDFPVYLTGNSTVVHVVKHTLVNDMRKFMLLAFLIVALFLFLIFRRISGVFLPLLVVFLSIFTTVGIMGAVNNPIKVTTQILPSFLLAVGVSAAVHIMAIFYHNLRKLQDKEKAIVAALRHSGLAVTMTSLTTAVGLFSFANADVAPVVDLGIFAGVGIMIALIYSVIFLPAMIALVPIKIKTDKELVHKNTFMDNILESISSFVAANASKILIATAIIFVIGIIGMVQMRFGHNVLKWFPKDHPIRIATEKIDDELRGTTNLEVIIDTGKVNGLCDPAILNKVVESIKFVESLETGEIFAGKAWAITEVLKETNRALNENRQEMYIVPQDKDLIAQELLLFSNSGSDDLEDFTDSQYRLIRLTAKLPFKDALDYTKFIAKINEHLQQTYPGAQMYVTGIAALFTKVITNTISSMSESYIIAFVVITLMMIFLIGDLKIGLISMVPNVLPICMTIGFMGFADIRMDLFVMLVGSIAIGLAVDDTIHFMHNFKRYFDETGSSKESIRLTLNSAGRAMLVTSCVLACGFFIYMFATLYNFYYFGLLTGITIVLALLADFFIAPSLMILLYKDKKIDGGKSGKSDEKVLVSANE